MNLLCKPISIGGQVLLEKHSYSTIYWLLFFLFINKWPGKSYLKFDISRGIYYVICWSSTLRMKWRHHWKVKQNKKPIKPHKHVSFAVRDEFLEIPRGYNLSARMWHTDASWNFSKKAYCVSKPLFNIIGFNVETQLGFWKENVIFFFIIEALLLVFNAELDWMREYRYLGLIFIKKKKRAEVLAGSNFTNFLAIQKIWNGLRGWVLLLSRKRRIRSKQKFRSHAFSSMKYYIYINA